MEKRILYRKASIGCEAILCILLIGVLALNSCNSDFPGDCFKSTGKLVWEERVVDNFHTISLHDNIDLYLIPDTINQIRIYAGENIIDKITSNIHDSVLELKNNNSCNWVRDINKPIEAHVHYTSLKKIEYVGHGNIKTVKPIIGRSFTLFVKEGHGEVDLEINTWHAFLDYKSGSSDVFFSGHGTNYMGVFAGGLGKFDSHEMQCSYVYINQMSNNHIHTYAKDMLVVEIHLFGNIYYKGTPEISIKGIYGEGKLLPLD